MTPSDAQLPTSEAFLKAIGQGVIVLGPDRTILFYSDWVARATRIPVAEALGRPVFAIFPEARDNRLGLAIDAALERGAATFLSHSLNSRLLPLYRPSDSDDPSAIIPQSTTVSGVPDPDGRWCCIVTITDVGPMLAREAALRRAKEEAEAANMAKSRFVANVSHELRTPLNAILGFADLLAERIHGPLGSPKYDDYIQYIADSGQHLLSLIDDILDLSKVESGQFKLEESVCALDDVARAAGAALRPQAQRNGQHLVLELPPAPVGVYADERGLRQICINLISNASKFSPADSRITVRVATTEAGEPHLCISDEGPGIPLAEQPHILSPYGQGRDVMTSRRSEGTGLGLPICKALTRLHDGHFELDSDVGQGTTVRITLPAWRARPDG